MVGKAVVMELPTNYNYLTIKQRTEARKEYERRQNGRCWFCNEKLSENPPEEIRGKPIDWHLFPKGFLINKIHLQHNHATGMTEGAVHAYCNAYMWQYEGR